MGEPSIAIIGAGMAGVTCGRLLAAAGLAPVLFEKSRGVGGRMATRRTQDGLQFDHGAQYVTARSDGFRAYLDEARAAGVAAAWRIGDRAVTVGAPGMNALVKHAAADLDIRLNTQIETLTDEGSAWRLGAGAWTDLFDIVVLAVPAPQAGALLGADHPIAREIAAARLAPCLTLMAAFPAGLPAPFIARRDPDHPLAWIAQDSAKSQRPVGATCWVAQAGPEWSQTHLEDAPTDIATRMLPMLCAALGVDPDAALHAAAHRWRYAAVAKPLGRPLARDAAGRLFVGGDWCLDARVEAAWESGAAIAREILERRQS